MTKRQIDTDNDSVIQELTKKIEARKKEIRELKSNQDRMHQKEQQLLTAAAEYNQFYNELMQSYGWSKSKASRQGFKSLKDILNQIRKNTDSETKANNQENKTELENSTSQVESNQSLQTEPVIEQNLKYHDIQETENNTNQWMNN